MADTAELLVDRGKVHGTFEEGAATVQRLKSVMSNGRNWKRLSDGQKQALEMIALKVARILSGDSDFVDHWCDIEGYARLVADALRDEHVAVAVRKPEPVTEQEMAALRLFGRAD